jgi:hypothetical protein
MTPAQYKAARKALDWTHVELASALGVSWRQSYRFAAGHTPIPEPVARLLRTLVRAQLTTSRQNFETYLNNL